MMGNSAKTFSESTAFGIRLYYKKKEMHGFCKIKLDKSKLKAIKNKFHMWIIWCNQ